MPPDSRQVDVQQERGERNPALAASATHQKLATAAGADDGQLTEPKLFPDEQELRRIIDLIPQTIVVLGRDGKAIFANRVALEYTGLSLDEVRADNFRERVFHPEDVQGLCEERQRGLSGSVPFENEQRARGKDGKYRWFLIRYNPLLDERGNVIRWYATGTDIEDRKQAENRLRQDEHELRQLIDLLPQHVLVLDRQGKLLQANQTMLDYKGFTLEEMKGGGDQQRMKRDVHPDDLERVQSERSVGFSRGVPFESEKRLLGTDGQFRWFLFRYKPMVSDDGEIVRWFATATDIDDRKRAEDLAAGEKRLLEMVTSGHSMQGILEALCQFVESMTGGCYCSVVLVDPSGTRLEHGAAPSLPDSFVTSIVGRPLNADSGPCAMAAYLNEQVIAADLTTETRWAAYEWCPMALAHGVRACWSMPISSSAGNVLGAFAIYYPEPRMPTPLDQAIIDQFTHIASITIERQRSQEALTSALDEIRTSEAKLRQVIDTIPTLAWCNLPDGPNEFLNKRWHDYTGLSPEESHGWGWQAAFHPEDLPSVMEKWRELLVSGEPDEIEARLRRWDGVFRRFLIRVEPFRDETGKIIRWYGTSTDIEALKQTEEKLREDERELRRITDAIPQAIVVQDPSGIPLYANQTTLDYTGLTLDDIVSPGFRERIFHPDDLERLRDERQAALARGLPFEVEQRALRRDGHYRWFLIRYNPFRGERGQVIRWYATGTDIDDRVRAEERTHNENLALREQIDRDSMFEDIVGSSEALRKVLRQVAKVAPSDSTVLILGETGTGKELIARAIHKRSNRAARAFFGVNCAAIPASLIASELFGHEKGAFTGATQRRLGRFEAANGGTIFLDEVGDLPPEIQIALLRVLQEREIERVGSNKAIPVDVRVLAATHHDLDTLVAEGKFRQDLLYRLSVVPIQMPSLRERTDDIPLLVDYFAGRFGKKAGKKFRTIEKKTVELFESYQWPGNVRELQNVIERAVILSDGDIFCVDETWLKRQAPQFAAPAVRLNSALQRQEKELIEAALAEARGRVSGPDGAATKLGLPRPTLDAKIKRLGIDKYRFKVRRSS
jgi:PAS domain S-box-containing protein